MITKEILCTAGFAAIVIAAIIGNIGMSRIDKALLIFYIPYTLIILAIAYAVCFTEIS